MMIDTIREAIASINEHDSVKISDWRLVERRLQRQERYYIAAQAEQARAVDEASYSLTVYVDTVINDKRFRGEATVTLQPTFSPEDCAAKIRQAVFAASKSHNPWFGLPAPSDLNTALPVSGFAALSSADQVDVVRRAFYSAAAQFKGSARINALELFITEEHKRLINSRGVDYSATIWRGYSEFVVEADSRDGPVELFDDIEFSEPDTARLAETIGDRLAQVRDRALARPTPQLERIPVILRGKEAEAVFSWFFDNSRTEMIYSKASAFEPGKNVQKASDREDVAEPLEVWAEPVIPGLPSSTAFDTDGFPLERTPVIEKGVLTTLIGSVRHADWLSVPRRGAFPLFSVSPGSMSLEAMHAAPYLEPVMFSDFQLDPVTGDFGAEVRLAYYFDGEKVIPVSGGSISGSLSTLRSSMRRSRETAVATLSRCPVAILLLGATITGIR